MYSELIDKFHGRRVVDFNDEDDWTGTEVAYRVGAEYEDDVSLDDRLDALLAQAGSADITALIVGAWTGACEGDNAKEVVDKLASLAPRLPKLKHLFLGEMTYEQCEISWINQSDVTPILKAFPKLESFRIRGGNELAFSKVKHENLRELAIESGGLRRSVLREIVLCDFPQLEHLELLLGTDQYGFDGTIEDLQPILSGRAFPKLKFLGLMNSEIANDIAAVVVNSPIIDRITELDLSMGNLNDLGLQPLHALAGKTNLKQLDLSHHYCSPKAIDELKAALSCKILAEDGQSAEDDESRWILHAE